MTDFVEGNFLGLPESDVLGDVRPDVVILQVPYELTVSYGEGTALGPAAALAASAQVELYDPLLPADLPAGFHLHTAPAWDGEGGSLAAQQDNIAAYLAPWTDGATFPVVLGGDHGMLPALMRGLADHPRLDGDLSKLTIVQIDAHADLRDELEGEPMSHACAARRSLDLGVEKILQVGIRAISREEAAFIQTDARVEAWPAREVVNPCGGEAAWRAWLARLAAIEGPIWLSLDVDGLDAAYVPTTGTPVPGGLAFWQAVETIEALAKHGSNWLGADVNEIVPDPSNHVTEFSAAMLATKIVAAHLSTRTEAAP